MLENFLFSLNTVLPIFFLVILGYLFKKSNLFPDAFYSASEKFVFRAALPAMIFLEISQAKIETVNECLPLMVFCAVGVVAAFSIYSVISCLFIKDRNSRGAFVQGTARANFAILGIPIAENLFGNEGVLTVSVLLPEVILLFNILSVVVLSAFAPSESKKSFGETAKGLLKSIITNPLIIAVLLAIPFLIFKQIALPEIAVKTITYLSNTTTPLALISLGAGFTFASFKNKLKYSVPAVLCKLIITPLIMIFIAYLCGLRTVSLGIVFILFGTPTAVSSYIMAKNMHNDYELSGQILLLTTMFCAFTLFLGIFLLKSAALI